MRLFICIEDQVFEAPTIWLTKDMVPTVGKSRLFDVSKHFERQEGPYNWIKIAIIDTVEIDLIRGCMTWLPAAYRNQSGSYTWNSVHPFVASGLLHNRNPSVHVSSREEEHDMSSREGDHDTSGRDGNNAAFPFEVNSLTNGSRFSIDDFVELLDKAANIVKSFKNKSLNGNELDNAIFGLLHVYILPIIRIINSNRLVLLNFINFMETKLNSCQPAEQNKKEMLEQMINGSVEVSNQVTNYFMFSNCNESNDQLNFDRPSSTRSSTNQMTVKHFQFAVIDESNTRFSFDIPFSLRSLHEIVIVMSSTRFSGTTAPIFENLHRNLIKKLQMQLEISNNRVSFLTEESNSLLFSLADTMWNSDITQLVQKICLTVFGSLYNLDENTLTYRKLTLLCLDRVFKTAYDQLILFYYDKYWPETELFNSFCRLSSSEKEWIKIVFKELMNKSNNQREIEDREDMKVNIKRHIASIYFYLDAIIKEHSLLTKGNLLVNVMRDIEETLEICSLEMNSEDDLSSNVSIFFRSFDGLLYVHIKMLSDFLEFAMPDDESKLSSAVNYFLKVYTAILQ